MVKYRLDGVLAQLAPVPGIELAEQVISRIKVMAELDIAERRVPQDGRFKVAFERRPRIDFRVSIMPSIFGEDAVLRMLDKRRSTEQMQRPAPGRARLRRTTSMSELRELAAAAYGMLLVTGPTGSGKTTTLVRARSPRPTTAATRSSPSRTRSSTSCRACCRSR